MTHEMQWKCVSEGNAWAFMKLSVIMLLIGLGMDAYLLLPHGADTLGGHILFLFLAFWSGLIGITRFALTATWLLMRGMTTCR